MEKTQRDNATDYQLASAIARYVELRDVRLTDLNANLIVAKNEMLQQPELDVELGRSMSCSIAYDTKALSVLAKLKADIHGPGDGDKRGKTLISIQCTYVLDYTFMVEGGPEGAELQSYLDAFARVNGVFNVWPYFRELVQSVSARMAIPPIVVPVYRVSKEQGSVQSNGNVGASVAASGTTTSKDRVPSAPSKAPRGKSKKQRR
jgi:hypothetical protein